MHTYLSTPIHSVSSVLVDHMRAVESSEPVTSMLPSSLRAIQLMLSSWSPIVSFKIPFCLLAELPFPILAKLSDLYYCDRRCRGVGHQDTVAYVTKATLCHLDIGDHSHYTFVHKWMILCLRYISINQPIEDYYHQLWHENWNRTQKKNLSWCLTILSSDLFGPWFSPFSVTDSQLRFHGFSVENEFKSLICNFWFWILKLLVFLLTQQNNIITWYGWSYLLWSFNS